MHEQAYGHPIVEVAIEDNDTTLTIRPLRSYGFDGLKYQSNEDSENGPHQIATPAANENDPRWKELLDKVKRRNGRLIEDGWAYWLVFTARDMRDGKIEQILYGIARRRLPK